jgi:general secretion pathway protein A
LPEQERQAGELDLSQIAQARRLHYLPFSGNLNLLTLLDLPVMVELLTPEHKEPRFVLLLRIDGQRCWVLGEQEQEVGLEVISHHWFGRAHLFWRNFEELEANLTLGSVGQSVKRLYSLLERAQVYSEPPSSTFDRKMQEAVALFQQAHRLVPDGIVGPFTLIMLYNSLPGYPHPHLRVERVEPSLHGEKA